MTRQLLITILFCSLNLFCNAQFRYMSVSESQALSKRTVLIKLFNENNDEAKEANEYIKKYLAPNLKIGKEVQCKTPKEVKLLLENHQEKYAILEHLKDDHDIEGRRENKETGFKESFSMANLTHYDLTLSIISKNPKIKGFVTEVDFVHYYLRKEDYVFAAKQFSLLYNASLSKIQKKEYYNVSLAMEKLKVKTLLIDSTKISFKMSKAKGYDNPLRFTNYDEIKNAVLNSTENIVYPIMIWCSQTNSHFWFVVDAETGEIYSKVAHGGVNYVAFGEKEPPGLIKKTQLKYFDSKLANKVNNRY